MINYLFSGIDKEKGFNKKQTEYLKKDIRLFGIRLLKYYITNDVKKINTEKRIIKLARAALNG